MRPARRAASEMTTAPGSGPTAAGCPAAPGERHPEPPHADGDRSADRNSVEVAHEALIRRWPRLRGWLAEDRAALRLRLEDAAVLAPGSGPAWRQA